MRGARLYRAVLAAALLPLGAAAQAPSEFVADGAGVAFYRFAVAEDALAGAPDRSALTARAFGPADRIAARGSHFWRVGADGQAGTADDERVRLYGVNLSFAANFPKPADAPRLARRLRRLGFNAVRLHHMDTSPDTRSDPPRSLLTPGRYPSFNPAAVERLRGLIAALAREGIYVDLNLRVGYRFRPAVDGVPPLDGGAAAAPLTSPVYIYTPRMQDALESYTRQTIRALGLRGSPSLALVEISNEASLLAAWQRREWQAAVPAAYAPELRRQWQEWAVQRHGSAAAACRAWGTCATADGPIDLLAPRDADASATPLDQLRQRIENRLRAASRNLFGEPAIDAAEPVRGAALRTADFLRFLAETDRRFFERLRRVVHEETDPLVPVTGTQMGYGGVLNYDSHVQQDYIDEHFYVDHPDFPGSDWDRNDWRIRDLSLAGSELDRLLGLALLRDGRRPFVVSEYSQPFPNRQGAEMAPLLAALGAQQDWDGLFLFDYHDGDTWNDAPTSFTLAGDWGKYALVGAAARIFRSPLVAPLSKAVTVPLPPAARLAVAATGDPRALQTWLQARWGVAAPLALQRRIGLDLADGAPALAARQDAPAPVDGGGALSADRGRGTVVLRTPQAAGFFGAAGTRVRLGDDAAALERAPESRGYASVLAESLDGRPLAASGRLLVSVGSAVRGTQPGSRPPRPTDLVRYRGARDWWTFEPDPQAPDKPSGARDTAAPVWIERVPATLRLATRGRTAAAWPLDGAGRRLAPLPASRVQVDRGMLFLQLQATPAESSPWYEVVVE
ncbi:capsular biosynthesis protein [Xylophilus sp.]|uniref:capsular biosynthesis protein n=1 Tax=Xylophilus sp. TaxID=2653893 RepID=UPI0013BDAC9F|nr:capsular biosynthesis protein [Xylophilus sp.]KAF1045988.1 MAG: hypothetical protein GAK38_02691 [Xylophilus sp.]